MRTDNEIMAVLIRVIREGLIAWGIDAVVQQSYQPTEQGAPTKATVLLHSIDSKRYGFPEDVSYFDEIESEMIKRESYWLERTYQVDALAIQNPAESAADLTVLTAFDYVDRVAALMQTGTVIEKLRAESIGILRVQPLRIGYVVDDKDRNEQVPSFDFTITYQQIILSTADIVTDITAEIYEV